MKIIIPSVIFIVFVLGGIEGKYFNLFSKWKGGGGSQPNEGDCGAPCPPPQVPYYPKPVAPGGGVIFGVLGGSGIPQPQPPPRPFFPQQQQQVQYVVRPYPARCQDMVVPQQPGFVYPCY